MLDEDINEYTLVNIVVQLNRFLLHISSLTPSVALNMYCVHQQLCKRLKDIYHHLAGWLMFPCHVAHQEQTPLQQQSLSPLLHLPSSLELPTPASPPAAAIVCMRCHCTRDSYENKEQPTRPLSVYTRLAFNKYHNYLFLCNKVCV